MALYTGNHCPVCNQAFADADDVVVCPDCGTPYHRACWQKVGACVHADQHAAGFVWTPDKAPDAPAADEARICPNCGAHNPPDGRFCNHCGVPLGQAEAGRPQSGAGPAYARPHMEEAPGAQGAAQAARQGAAEFGGVYRRELRPDDTIDGIKAKDWASYLGPSSLMYLAQFVRMEELKRRFSVSLSAFFLGPVYFFYRKMWKEGALFTALGVVLSLPTVLALFAAAGSPLVAGLDLGWLTPLSWVFVFLDWAQMLLRSLFANFWYKKDAARRIRAICAQLPDGEDRSDALAMRGGTSAAAVVLFCLGMAALSVALYWALGPGRDQAMNVLLRAYMM